MYYLRIYNYDVNGFGFVVDKIHDITPDDIPISNEEHELFLEKYNGRDFRVRSVKAIKLFDLLEECFVKREY